MAKLQDFITSIKTTGLMRTARYSVIFPTFAPNVLDNLIGMYCDQIQLPGYNINTTPSNTYGETREIPYGRLFDPITVSFYVDNDMKVKKYFDDWIFKIQNPHDRTFNYYNKYTVDLQVNVEDLENNIKYSYVLYECYPKTIGAIQLDYASKDVMKLPITLVYKYWKPRPLNNEYLHPTYLNSNLNSNNNAQTEPVGVFTGKTNPLTIQYDALQIANMEIAASGNKGVKINQSGW